MNRYKRALAGAAIAGSMLVGGVAGAVIYAASTITASAAGPAAVAAAASPSPSATAPGKFVPNEDPAHEAGESAAREAQENAGQVPTLPLPGASVHPMFQGGRRNAGLTVFLAWPEGRIYSGRPKALVAASQAARVEDFQ